MDLNIKTNDKGHLDIGGADACELVEQYGTPIYVIDEERVRDNYNRFYNAFTKFYPKFKVFYACKANTNIAVLKILEEEGCCIDAVSPGEVYICKKMGFSGDRILFTGNNIRNDEMDYVNSEDVILNIDSVSALKRLAESIDPNGKKISFGVIAKELGFEPVGMHSHIGSGILDPEPFKLAIESTMNIAGKVHQEAGIDFEFIDFGGGVGIPYTPDEELLDLEHFAEENVKLFKEKLEEFDMGEPTLYLEPGRYIVGDASVILVEVNSVKESYRKFIGVDAGFNTLLRPAMYDSYHHIVVANKMNEEPTQEVDVAGNVCESGDLFARDRPLPDIEEGDILGILNAGAYGYTMASNYNSRPLPAEILVKNGESFVIREAQSYDDIFEKQSVPDHLQ